MAHRTANDAPVRTERDTTGRSMAAAPEPEFRFTRVPRPPGTRTRVDHDDVPPSWGGGLAPGAELPVGIARRLAVLDEALLALSEKVKMKLSAPVRGGMFAMLACGG